MSPKLINTSEHLSRIGDGFDFLSAMLASVEVISRHHFYRIDKDGLDHPCESATDVLTGNSLDTYKFEDIELASEAVIEAARQIYKAHIGTGPVKITAHMFVAKAGSYSFPVHQDPVDVVVFCIDGCKTMEVDGKNYIVRKGMGLLMPANIPHRATNKYDSIMLSLGFEKINQ